ncbi:MAG TPA: hypothetical protein DD706_03240 [Nitrospiraceae bacterium]|nr:hypothetical protein [Nitrospiraceae bacterium]
MSSIGLYFISMKTRCLSLQRTFGLTLRKASVGAEKILGLIYGVLGDADCRLCIPTCTQIGFVLI